MFGKVSMPKMSMAKGHSAMHVPHLHPSHGAHPSHKAPKMTGLEKEMHAAHGKPHKTPPEVKMITMEHTNPHHVAPSFKMHHFKPSNY